MKKFIITSDSSCDLTASQVKALDVSCAYLSYTIGNDIFYDDMIESHIDNFYRKMRDGAVPATSQVPPAQFEVFFKEAVKKNLPVLHISISSALSGTYRSATIAANEVMEENPDADIRVIDSTVASAGLAMLIYEAVKYRDKGRSIEEAVAHIEGIKAYINTFVTTDDLSYMRRGGRVSMAGAIVSSVMKISPLITLSHAGKLYVSAKIRGSKVALEKFVESVKDSVVKPEAQTLYIVHADAESKAKEFGEKLKERLGFRRIQYMKFGTTIGAHGGPGTISAFYFGKLRPIRL